MKPVKTKDKTVLRSLGLGGYFGGGAEGMVDVKDGKIVRVRPMQYGWKYKKEEVRQWKMERNGKTIEPTWKSLPGPFSLAYKKRVYSPNRIQFPMKRVDWDPDGERNTQNRGKSKYVRISWDEASKLIASEIRRVHKQYGYNGILMQGDGHDRIHDRSAGKDDRHHDGGRAPGTEGEQYAKGACRTHQSREQGPGHSLDREGPGCALDEEDGQGCEDGGEEVGDAHEQERLVATQLRVGHA